MSAAGHFSDIEAARVQCLLAGFLSDISAWPSGCRRQSHERSVTRAREFEVRHNAAKLEDPVDYTGIVVHILGIVTRTHDSGLALLNDGVPTIVLEEERFNREKHTRKFPFLSLKAAFDDRGLDLDDIDVITMPWEMKSLRRTMFWAVVGGLPVSLNLIPPSARPLVPTLIVLMPNGLRWGLIWHFGKIKRLPKIIQVPHHDAHAAIFFVSPFEEAITLVMDGHGDETAQSAYIGSGNRLQRLWQSGVLDSLGMLYTAVTEYLGFKLFEEGTVMALAATGGPTYAKKFRELVLLQPDGRFSINRDFISYDTHGFKKLFKERFNEAFGPRRQQSEPISDRHRDLAFALQSTIEETILHVVRALSKSHPSRSLCLTGGVALNCVANGRILRDTDYRSVWVPPCASDSGAPLGSALWHYHQTLGHRRRFELTHPYHGTGYSDAEIIRALQQAGLAYRRTSEHELLAKVARDLATGKIVGWFQGRFEIGPRALGNRSILADARDAAMKDYINARVKHREPFRPFAPAVLEDRAAEFFEIDQSDPFMTMASRVRVDKAHMIPAAVHVDGTARIQTIDRTSNRRFYGVIEAFAELTGIPVILNTSFNRQEPIVARPEEAISCYLRTDMDVLVLGDFYITDRNPPPR
jgi:carbamoyltransferase